MLLMGFVWGILGGIVGLVAHEAKGRSFWPWAVYGFLIFPVALIHALCLKKHVPVGHIAPHKTCGHCAETIKREAKVCRFCGRDQLQPA